MSKDILFYSNNCDYSKKIYNILGERSSIMCVCVDDPNTKLPTFVQAVPMIYIPSQKRIIVDEGVELWTKTNFGTSNASPQNNQGSPQNNQGSPQNNQGSPQDSSGNNDLKGNSIPSGDYFTGGLSFSTQFSALEGEDINGLDGGCGFADLSMSPKYWIKLLF